MIHCVHYVHYALVRCAVFEKKTKTKSHCVHYIHHGRYHVLLFCIFTGYLMLPGRYLYWIPSAKDYLLSAVEIPGLHHA